MANSQNKLLTIYLNGGKKVTYTFSSRPVISFTNDNLIVKNTEQEITSPLSIVTKYTVNETEQIFDPNHIIIDEDETKNFHCDSYFSNCHISYYRTFDDTEWQPLYVPFEIKTESLFDEFQIATINNFHQYDDDGDGISDRTELEIKKVITSETLLPNYPYLIKAKSTGRKKVDIYNTILYPTEQHSVDCSSVEILYSFTGTYNLLSDLRSDGYYNLTEGQLVPIVSSYDVIPPFRWYMTMMPRTNQFKDSPIILCKSNVRIMVVNDEIDGIDDVNMDVGNTIIHTINGYKVDNFYGNGIYTIRNNNGLTKKIMIKK